MEGMDAKRRRPDFIDEELIVMLREVTAMQATILGKLDGTRVTKQTKNSAWEVVTEAFHAVSAHCEEAQRKFFDFAPL